jgi:hypothetical protein
MGAAEEPTLHLYAVTDYPALAVFTHRRETRDGALERVEDVHATADRVDLKGQPVVIAAYLTYSHSPILVQPGDERACFDLA